MSEFQSTSNSLVMESEDILDTLRKINHGNEAAWLLVPSIAHSLRVASAMIENDRHPEVAHRT